MEDHPDALAGVDLIGGEAASGSSVSSGAAQRWRPLGRPAGSGRLGGDPRRGDLGAGWFGPVAPRLADRFGDVLVAMASDRALMTLPSPTSTNLVGMHGSLTDAGLTVPLLIG